MGPPIRVASRNSSTQNELTKSSSSSDQNGSTRRSRSKSPKNISNSIVNETPPSVGKMKILNLKRFTFAKLRSAAKSYSSKENGLTKCSSSKQNGLTKSNGSKSPKNSSWSIVNEAPSNTENISWSIVDEAPPGIAKCGAPNQKLFTFAELKSAAARNSEKIEAPNLKSFTFAELKSATGNFGSDALLGEGGFGEVFKGWVHEKTYAPSTAGVGIAVAVKKLSLHSVQGVQEWQTEIEFLGNLSHPNIIKLVGYCSEEDKEYLLVYEYARKGSLETCLFTRIAEALPWSMRLKIAIGAARGLAFLHTSDKPIIYRDFKSANILLDGDYNAKLSDFGLAKFSPSNGDAQVTTQIKGTLGPTNSDMQVTTQISWPSGDTQVTTQIRGMLSSVNSDTQLTTQISWSNCQTHLTTHIKSMPSSTNSDMLGSTNSDMHVTTQIKGMSNLANGDKHVTTNIRTCPTNNETHVTTQIGGALHPANGGLHMSTGVVGTFGYAAPEYIMTGHLYVKSDVYGFGVVFLEILTGRRAMDRNMPKDEQDLAKWAKPLLSKNRNLNKIMDRRLGDEYPPKGAYQAAQLALKCLNHNPKKRPSMIEVLEKLEQIYAIQ